MAHDYEDEITCPYCDYVFSDSWEHNDDDGERISCPACDREFTLSVNVEVTYSTERMECSGDHDWDKPTFSDIDQELCDRWNSEAFINRTNHAPHRQWVRRCKNCEEAEYSQVEIGGTCPWEAAPQEGGDG